MDLLHLVMMVTITHTMVRLKSTVLTVSLTLAWWMTPTGRFTETSSLIANGILAKHPAYRNYRRIARRNFIYKYIYIYIYLYIYGASESHQTQTTGAVIVCKPWTHLVKKTSEVNVLNRRQIKRAKTKHWSSQTITRCSVRCVFQLE